MTTDLTRYRTSMPAAPSDEDDSPDEAVESIYEMLSFTLADERYAIPLRTVREILKLPPVTAVPRAPHDVLGIISVRGRVTTVIDLRRRLRLPEGPHGKQTRILLVDDGEDEVVGVIVDAVMQVHRLAQDEVELASAMEGDPAEYVAGIGRPSGRASSRTARGHMELGESDLLILLDPGPLLRR